MPSTWRTGSIRRSRPSHPGRRSVQPISAGLLPHDQLIPESEHEGKLVIRGDLARRPGPHRFNDRHHLVPFVDQLYGDHVIAGLAQISGGVPLLVPAITWA